MAKILVIEDSDNQRAEICAAIDSSGLFDAIVEARDGIEGLRLYLSEVPDIVLCDLEMPGLDGEKLLRMRGGAEIPTPFLVLTAVSDPARRAHLLEIGASDTIAKPFHEAELLARVALHLKLIRAQRELVAKNLELERLSRTDSLTGIANRRQLDEWLQAEFRRSQRYETPFGVVLADIDHFKGVNDVHGHLVGDQVLQRVAELMRQVTRASDCVGRFGGEEFLAILGNNVCSGIEIFAERCRQAIEGMEIEAAEGGRFSVTMSLGIAAWHPDIESPEALVQRADQALYEAKAAGRNRVCVYSSKDGASGDSRS